MAETLAAAPADTWDGRLIELFECHREALVQLAKRTTVDDDTAEEVVHDVFLAYHEKGCRPAPGAELGYLRRMVVNRAYSVARRAIRGRELTVPDWFHDPTPEDRCVDRDDAEAVRNAVASLPTRQRQVLHLRYVRGLSEARIAEVLDISNGSVKTHASRGREAMRQVLLPLL